MRYRQLPRTNLELSELCFGTARFVPADTGPDGWKDGFSILDASLEAGMNVLHSSPLYNTTEALADYLKRSPRAGELHHVVKVHAPDYHEKEMDLGALREEVELQLRNLNTDHIAVLQHLQRGPECPKSLTYNAGGDPIRIPAMETYMDSLMEFAQDLKDEGKIGTFMSFPHTMGFNRAIMDRADIDGVIHFFDVLETEMVPFFDEMKSRNMGFIVIRPLLKGTLTDKRNQRDRLPKDDPQWGQEWDPWYELLDRIRPVIGEPERFTEFAIRFALAPEVVTTAVVGLNTHEQLNTALAAVDDEPLPEEVVRDVHEVISQQEMVPKETLFYEGAGNAEGRAYT